MRLVLSHVELAKAELAAIGGEIARVAALAGLALAVVIFAVILVVVGTSLFLGEWILGSMGWGILHGLLLFIAIALAAALLAVGIAGVRIASAFAVALVVGLVVGVAFALAIPNLLYTAAGDALAQQAGLQVDPGLRPLVVGAAFWGIIGLLLGIGMALRVTGAGMRFGTLLLGLLGGIAFGAFTAIDFEPQVGAGIGIAVGYLTWIALMAVDVGRTGIDVEALKVRFTPTQTIETSKETLEWLQKRMPPGIGS